MLGDRVPHRVGHYLLACEDALREQIAIGKTQRVLGKAGRGEVQIVERRGVVPSSRTTSATPCVVSA